MSLHLVLGLAWKCDHILGHIYAEIGKILKGSQTFKLHCMRCYVTMRKERGGVWTATSQLLWLSGRIMDLGQLIV